MTEAALTIREDAPPAMPTQSPTAEIFSMIDRASRDPNVDIEKFERLMAMQERQDSKRAETAFNIAMKDAQSEMGTIGADANNPQTRSKYATYAKLDSVLRPIYTRHGFSLSFDEDDSPKPDHIRVVCYVAHEAGHTRTYRKDMPADGKGAKGGDVMTKTHAAGAAASYGARYLLKGIFNIAVGEEDKDGNVPADQTTISEEQEIELRELIEAAEANEAGLKAYFKVDHLKDMLATKFPDAKGMLQRKLQNKARG